MSNLLDTSQCPHFKPSFTESECDFYQFAENNSLDRLEGVCGYCTRPGGYRCLADIARIIPLSHSSVDAFLTCHYLYYLKKILGIEMRPSQFNAALKAGKLWDIVKQKHLGADVNIKETINEYEIDPMVVAKVRGLFHAYKELAIEVEPGYEIQKKVEETLPIVIPASAFMPLEMNSSEGPINFWGIRDELSKDVREWMFPLDIVGYYDRKYQDHFCEDKLTSRPGFYLDPFYLQSQNATYFLGDEDLEYCIQEIVLLPMPKVPVSGFSDDDMYARVKKHVLSRPSEHFSGYDRKQHMYGKKFYRGEFDLDAAAGRYRQVVLEILSCRWTGNFYRNFKSCNNMLPGIPCDMQTICRAGNVSENMYRIRGRG